MGETCWKYLKISLFTARVHKKRNQRIKFRSTSSWGPAGLVYSATFSPCQWRMPGNSYLGPNHGKHSHTYLGGGFKHFYFHPFLGKWSNLTNILDFCIRSSVAFAVIWRYSFTICLTHCTEGTGVAMRETSRHGVKKNLTNIFQMGWNHQLVIDFIESYRLYIKLEPFTCRICRCLALQLKSKGQAEPTYFHFPSFQGIMLSNHPKDCCFCLFEKWNRIRFFKAGRALTDFDNQTLTVLHHWISLFYR